MNILQELIHIASEDSLATPAGLAERLNVSQELVELMLADLERKGYLKAVTGGCHDCSHCGIKQACGSNPARIWVRTEK